MSRVIDRKMLVSYIRETIDVPETSAMDINLPSSFGNSTDLGKRQVMLDALTDATYKYILGKLIYDSTPDEIKAKMDMEPAQFIIVAGTAGAAMISYKAMMERIADVKDTYDAGDDVTSIETGETLSDSKVDSILEVAGFIKSTIETVKSKLIGEAIETKDADVDDSTAIDNIAAKVPEAIVDLVGDKDFSNFTDELMSMIKVDIRKDIEAGAEIESTEKDLALSVGGDADSDNPVEGGEGSEEEGGAPITTPDDTTTTPDDLDTSDEATDPFSVTDDDRNKMMSNVEGEDDSDATPPGETEDDTDDEDDKNKKDSELLQESIRRNRTFGDRVNGNYKNDFYKMKGVLYIEMISTAISNLVTKVYGNK